MTMNKKLLFRLVALVAAMMCALGSQAAEAYANYTPLNKTLTFYYDNLRSTRTGYTYDLNTGLYAPDWSTVASQINKVEFNSSFTNARPTSTARWFANMTSLTSITGISYLNTSAATNMNSMFFLCSGLTNLNVNGFNTANVTDMGNMFANCSGLTSLDLTSFNTAKVTYMSGMFADCLYLTSLNLSNFNTSNVTDMSGMFSGCCYLTSLNLNSFNTAKVTKMSSMFADCARLTSLDLSSFNTAKVTSMRSMFLYCSGLSNLDLSSFNTSQVSNMEYMFDGCSKLTTIYAGSGWNTDAVTSSNGMFNDCTNLVGGQGTTYNAEHVSKEYAHIDGGSGNPGYLSSKLPAEPYAEYTSDNTTLTFHYDNVRAFRAGTTYDLNTSNNDPGWHLDNNYGHVTKVVFDSSFANARPTSTFRWFSGMNNLTSITGITYLNTSQVTNMYAMFSSCSGLTSLNVSKFNTAKVTNMANMFYGCSGLTSLNVSNFNTAKVTAMTYMFNGCSGLNSLNVSNFNTAKVTDMSYMFQNCSGLTSLDLSNFNTANVTNLGSMFRSCTGLTSLNVSNFNTAKVTSMVYLFYGCSGLTSLDLSHFNTASVTIMNSMFCGCTNLTTIYAGSDWSTAAVTNSTYMFYYCTKLVGGMGTTFDANHTDKAYAHIDGGPSNPGYLTDINPQPYACYTPSNTTLTFYYDNLRSTRTGTTYDLNDANHLPVWYTDSTCRSVTKVIFSSSFAGARPTSTRMWFGFMGNLTSITGMSYLNTEDVTSMLSMFNGCKNLTSIDVSHFNTAKVTDISGMFLNCTRLTSLNLSNFNTAKVTTMTAFFNGCSGLTSLDLSSFNTANVTSMYSMFYGCSKLTTIYAGSGWTTNAVSNSRNMFTNCTKLVGGMGTTFDANHVDKAYAHIDGGPSNPGYFTEKVDFVRGDVNGNGVVNMDDLTALINYLVYGTAVDMTGADANLSGDVGMDDLTALINYLVYGHF